jgi:hypothetical protein
MREMMEQFQQCFVNAVRMVTMMQQEQTALICEQMRQVQDLVRELREKPASPPPPAPVTSSPGPLPHTAKAPTPKAHSGATAESLTDAHDWFLDRLAKIGQSPNSK